MNEVYLNKPRKRLQEGTSLLHESFCILITFINIRCCRLICLFVVAFLITVGCASKETLISADNNRIYMQHYSVELPINRGWAITEVNEKKESVVLAKKYNAHTFGIYLGKNWTAKVSMKSWTAKQVADDYREGEKWNMILQCAKTGECELKDVVMGEEIIDDKKFYFMEYALVQGNLKPKSYLYLYFPKEKQIDIFIVSIYTECCFPLNSSQTLTLKHEYIEMLKTINMIH